MHDHPRRAQARRVDGDQPDARHLPRRCAHPRGVPAVHRHPRRQPLNVQLTAALALLLAASAVLAQDTRSEYLQMFDGDGDGRVSEAEYLAYMDRSFRGMDSNGDGILETG